MFTHGTADPFGSIDELRAAAALIPAPSEIVEVTGALATTWVPRRSMCQSWRWTRRYGCCRDRPGGSRFSMKASMPSRPSWWAKLAAITPDASS